MRFSGWTLLGVGLLLSFSASSWATESATATVLDAKNGVVAAALAARQVRLDWDKAEALLAEAESALHLAQIEGEQADGKGSLEAAAQQRVSAAEKRWRRALSALEAQEARLGRAEMRLERAEGALNGTYATLSTR